VYIVNETPGILHVEQKRGSRGKAIEQARRWMYTAVSRAEHTVTVTAAK
jgi:superfamily I DNA/RNA helicase